MELSIELPAGCSGTRLQEAVAVRCGTGQLAVAGAPLSVLTVGTAPLVNGAVLTDGPAGGKPPAGRTTPGAPLLLAVLSGPGSGMVLPLHRGSYRIGRSGSGLAIPDAELSREHARLDVSDSAITLADLGSTNGTLVDGRQALSAPVSTGSLIRCGSSSLGVLFREVPPGKRELQAGGVDTSEPLRVPAPGHSGQRPLLLLLTAALPLGAGVALAAVTGMWMFLAFSAFSTVPLLLPALSGRRQRRALRDAVAAAARADGERRRRAAPPAAGLVLAAAGEESWNPGSGAVGEKPQDAPSDDSGPVWLRLGMAEQAANVRLEPPDPGFRPPPGGLLPVTLDPSLPTVVNGAAQEVAGLVRFFVMQLAGYPRATRTWVHLHGTAAAIPLSARFLARVSLSTSLAVTAARLRTCPGPEFDRGVLILLPGSDSGPGDALRSEASRLGWQLIDCLPGAAPAGGRGQSITLRGRTGRLAVEAAATEFIPDLVPAQVFDRFCRHRAAACPPASGHRTAAPASCSLDDILPLSTAELSRRWAAAPQPQGQSQELAVPVGCGAAGTVRIGLQSDGPHLLVAGTTGSGKSEFLRTLAAGLAASYPPDRLNLLFVDFKGGSGLGPLTGLPHCVGFLTDLDGYEVGRTLASLRAEVRRREKVLADAGAPDVASHRAVRAGLPSLPHLVLVIDEFRMLVEDAPAALTELMRIAVIGRSLGIHLVMATQRPQGALTADIRANVTSCVVLRVQSDVESLDVMNSPLAAGIPIGRPGRAYLVRGRGAPEEFQTASLCAPAQGPAADTITVMAAEAMLDRPADALVTAGAEAAPATPAECLAPFVEAAARLWRLQGGAPAHRPVAPPLPAAPLFPVAEDDPDSDPRAALGLLLGVMDLPEQQRVARLDWEPDQHGHLALIGGTHGPAAGGPVGLLLLVLDQLLGADAESHLYLLDADGSLARAATSPRVGAWVGPQDPQRAARVLARIADEMTRRLDAASPLKPQPLVLVLHNWGSWVSAFRSGPLAWAEDLVHNIVRDGPKAHITAVLSGERELVTSRFFAALPNRIYFPVGSTEESRLAWPPLPRLPELPGRVAVSGFSACTGPPGGNGMPAGNAAPDGYKTDRHTDDGHRWSADAPRAGQLYQPAAGASPGLLPRSGKAGAPGCRPFRVEPLPALVTAEEVRARLEPSLQQRALQQPGLQGPRLWIGVAGDELLPAGIVLPPGGILAVLGAPGSGKSALLHAMPRLNPSRRWLHPGEVTGHEAYWSGIHAAAVAGTLDAEAILLADDLDVGSADANRDLLELNGLGWTVVFTAGFSPGLQHCVPLAFRARSHGKAVLIAPRSLMDGDLFGVRFEPEPHPPAGRAVMISDGRAASVQLALAPETPP